MKKISLITIHTGPNFGTVLQVMATVKILALHNFSTMVVNYIPPRCTYKRIFKRAKNLFPNKPIIIRHLLSFIAGIHLIWLNFKYNEKIYLGCLKKWCNLSSPIYAKDDFALKCPKADFYVTGSDQVWNTYHNEGIDTHYFFDGIIGKKIALSSSIGMDTLSNDEIKEFTYFLSNYSAISVREQSAVDLLRKIGIDSIQVLDPTLMLNRIEWYNMLHCKRLVKENYLLVYIPYNIHDKEEIYRLARNLAKEKSLRVVTFSWNNKKEHLADYTFNHASPIDFVSLMYYADFVITNSFHGTAFSINLNREFFVYMPTKFPTRILSLLKMCNLENRIIKHGCDNKSNFEKINYKDINAILEIKRKDMHLFIENSFV